MGLVSALRSCAAKRSRVFRVLLAVCLMVAVAQATSSAASSPEATRQSAPNLGSTHGVLFAVSCSSSTACTAVGNVYGRGGIAEPFAERWNGSDWRRQRLPVPAKARTSLVVGVSCATGSSCTAVGGQMSDAAVGLPTTGACSLLGPLGTAGCAALPLVERWNGTRWSIERVRVPAGAVASSLAAVSCASAAACIAVGSFLNATAKNAALVERRNGSSWSIQRAPSPHFSSLASISCTTVSACTTVGTAGRSTLAEKWNGTRWSVQRTPNGVLAALPGTHWSSSALGSVSCISATSCAAVGSVRYACAGCGGETEDLGLTEHWNGSLWKVDHNPTWNVLTGGDLGVVSCSSATACIAIGSAFGSPSFALATLRWDGKRWILGHNPDPPTPWNARLSGLSCPSSSSCEVVGAFSHSEDGPNVPWAQRWDGSRWMNQDL